VQRMERGRRSEKDDPLRETRTISAGPVIKRGGQYAALRCVNPSCKQRIIVAELAPGEGTDHVGARRVTCDVCKTEADYASFFVHLIL
jgi:hypothetical protein